MSAPTSHDPLVVNTRDGVCWERRAVTDSGLGLYAVEGSCKCPPFKMATLAELAERGIVGSADALPVPVGPEAEELLPVAFLASRDSRVLGLYGQSEDALHHCENALGRTVGYCAGTPFSWRERPGGIRELYAWTSQDVSSATGFTVARLELRDEFDEGWGADADVVPDPVAVLSSERPVDGLTTVFVPVASLREPDGEFYGLVHHDWRLGRDLPEGGLQ